MGISEHVSLHVVAAVLLVVSGCSAALADEIPADYVEGEKSAPLVTPDVEAMVGQMLGTERGAAFLHALKLQMTKYDRDMREPAGRRAWHGRLVREEIHTNELVKVEVYSNEVDGATWRYRLPFKPPSPPKRPRPATIGTNGVPARLAAARARRNAERTNAVETVTLDVNANQISGKPAD